MKSFDEITQNIIIESNEYENHKVSTDALKPWSSSNEKHHRIVTAAETLHNGIKNKSIKNPDFEAAKDTINRAVDHATSESSISSYHAQKSVDSNPDNYHVGKVRFPSAMGTHNLPSAHRESVKVAPDHPHTKLLSNLQPLHHLVKQAKPFIVKRQPKGEAPPPTKEETAKRNTCQICGKEHKAKHGLIAHHGFTRPGLGWQTASCMGARHKPYEESRDQIPHAINSIRQHVEHHKNELHKLMSNPPDHFMKKHYTGYGSSRRIEKETRHDKPTDFNPHDQHYSNDEYTKIHRIHQHEHNSNIRIGTQDINHFQHRYDTWKKLR